jgi:hypothetical protein
VTVSQHAPTDAVASPRRLMALAGWSMLIGVPLAIVAGAAAEIVVAPAAVIIALIITRDGYVTSLAPSYAPFAAATILPWLISAVVLWGLISPLLSHARRRHVKMARVASVLGGAVATAGGFGLAFIITALLPLTRSYTAHLLDIGRLGLVVSLYSGTIAGYVSTIRAAIWSDETTIKRLIPYQALFAWSLAVLLEGSIAALTALGWL